ncbi:MAG: alpha/beta fold hydrolase [Chloroflexota bacterium]|nr:MAG: alpha/beta fold hydrolase [Chloroflexota bacterium]
MKGCSRSTRNISNKLLQIVVAILLLTGCSQGMQANEVPGHNLPGPESQRSNPPESHSMGAQQPLLDEVDCWFEIPNGAQITCGYLNVPEDRSLEMTPENTIRLAVAIFRSRSESPAPDPVVYQVGGPGGHLLNIVPYIYEKVFAPFLATRDLILLDPRGAGYSQPALECSDGEEAGNCVRRLFAEGNNLYVYNSSSMAADLQELRKALGYDRWNLLGQSYGTHVAQIVLREQPEGLRSVILDSVVPVVLPALPGGMDSYELALDHLLRRCEQDQACKAAYPDLESKLDEAVERLNTQPVTLTVDAHGEEKAVLVTGERMVQMLKEALYEVDLIPSIPYAITAAAEGSNYEFWSEMVRWEATIDILLSSGAYWAIQCGDAKLGSLCEDWPAAIELAPVTSDIPVLVMSGEFDPVTPPEFGQAVARSLPNSYVFEFPGMGHWVNGTGHPCQIAMNQAFLEDPGSAPEAGCMAALSGPDFFIKELNIFVGENQ